jgi:5-methylcytosine-specific restriction endonuclease McrA
MSFQGLLFGDDAEERAQEEARLAAKVYAEARKLAWEQGRPFPQDEAKWYAAHRGITNARCRESYATRYAEASEFYLHSGARHRAEQLGCKIGRRGPILKAYRRAVHASVILCYWCKRLTAPGERHVDHIEPLATGGAHAAGNLCVACTDCNLAKGDSSPIDFRKVVAQRRAANSVIAADYFRRVTSA